MGVVCCMSCSGWVGSIRGGCLFFGILVLVAGASLLHTAAARRAGSPLSCTCNGQVCSFLSHLYVDPTIPFLDRRRIIFWMGPKRSSLKMMLYFD